MLKIKKEKPDVNAEITKTVNALRLIAKRHRNIHKLIRKNWGSVKLNVTLNRIILSEANTRKFPSFVERRRTERTAFSQDEAAALLSILEIHSDTHIDQQG